MTSARAAHCPLPYPPLYPPCPLRPLAPPSPPQAQHYAARSGCLNAFVALIGNGRMPLVPAATKVDRASAFWLWR